MLNFGPCLAIGRLEIVATEIAQELGLSLIHIYGTMEKASGAELAFLEEHCEVMIEHDAIKKLAAI